jgi:hypothetical protein
MKLQNDIIFFGTLAVVLHYSFLELSALWQANDLIYYQSAPMCYRLYTDLLLSLVPTFSFALVTAMSFLISMALTWSIVRKTDELPLFMFGIVIVCMFLRTADAPMYVFLALLAKTKRPELLIPLTLIKEVALWLGIGYVLLFCRTKKSLVFAGISVTIYAVIRFLIIGDRPSFYPDASIFLLPMVLSQLFNMSLSSIFFDCGIAIILVIVTIRTRRESLLALWLLVPIVLFSVAWEPQHWFMLTVLLIAHRLRLTHPTSPAPATGDGIPR